MLHTHIRSAILSVPLVFMALGCQSAPAPMSQRKDQTETSNAYIKRDNDIASKRIMLLSGFAEDYADEHNGYLPDASRWEKQLQPYAKRYKENIWTLVIRPLPQGKRRFQFNRDAGGLRIRPNKEVDDYSYGRLVLFVEGDAKSSTGTLDNLATLKDTFYVGLLGEFPIQMSNGRDACCGTTVKDFIVERKQVQELVRSRQAKSHK